MIYSDKQILDMIILCNYHLETNVNVNPQIIKTIEELSSLNKLLAKLLLREIKPHDIDLLDELFDADNMIFQLKRILLPDDCMKEIYDNIVNAKLERELKRWRLI